MKQATAQILRSPMRRMATILLGIVTATGVLMGTSRADDRRDAVTAKMFRQIGVMEKIVDKVLVDSPNFLVRIDDNTRGLFVPEYGVIFTLDASLTGGMVPDMSKLMGNLKSLSRQFEVQTDKDGNSTIVIKKKEEKSVAGPKAKIESKDESGEGDMDEEKGSSSDEEPVPPPPPIPPTPEAWVMGNHVDSKKAADLYAAGKDELIQALLDYGDTLTSLRSGQHVMLAAFLRDNDYFKENKISRLVIKADIDDLRAYGEGKLSDKEAKARIDVEEY